MLDSFLAGGRQIAPESMRSLVSLTKLMPESTRAQWTTRFLHVYGELAGQRRLDDAKLRDWIGIESKDRSIHDIIFGIQTYYALVADLLAVSALEQHPQRFLQTTASQSTCFRK